MKVTIVGTGYVGLVSGACLAEVGNQVLCLDHDEVKINRLLKGDIPIFEYGLAEIVRRNVTAGRLNFTTDVARAVQHGDIQLIAVGTPPNEDGSADMQHVLTAARNIGRHMIASKVVIIKSTVPVGTSDLVREAITAELSARANPCEISVVSNPEFLKEGAAVEDFMRPDRIIVGSEDPNAIRVMRELYAPFQRNHERLIVMDTRSAELTKYAANAMLATRITFMNELANLSETVGADIEFVRRGIGADPRIGYHFLYPGCGYGGSCFPKDVQALLSTATHNHHQLRVLTAVQQANEFQRSVLSHKVKRRFGKNLTGIHLAIWGLAFKPDTDDMREAPSQALIKELLAAGGTVSAFDPIATSQARCLYAHEKRLTLVDDPLSVLDAVTPAHALIIVTEWKTFRSPDFGAIRARLAQPIIFDGRNLYEPSQMQANGFEYYPIGRAQGANPSTESAFVPFRHRDSA